VGDIIFAAELQIKPTMISFRQIENQGFGPDNFRELEAVAALPNTIKQEKVHE